MTRILDLKLTWRGACLALAAVVVNVAGGSGRLNAEPAPAAATHSCEDLFHEAARCEREGRFEEARALYEELCQHAPHDGDAWHRLAVVSMRLGHKDRGVECFEAALGLKCDDADLLNDYGFAMFLTNRLERSEELLRCSLEVRPDNPRAVNNLAIVVGALGRDDECRRLLEQVVSGATLEKNLAFVRALRKVRPAVRQTLVCPDELQAADAGDPSETPVAAPAPELFTVVPARPSPDVPDAEQDVASQERPARDAASSVDSLVARLTDADPYTRLRALTALSDLAGEALSAVAGIEPLLSDPDPAVRAEAARALWLIASRSETAVPALVELLSCEDRSIRVVAAFTLGNMGAAAGRSLPVLETMMTERTGIERIHAAEAVLRIARDGAEAIAVLTAAVHDPDPEVRFVAIYALGLVAQEHDTHDHQALGALRTAATQDPHPRIREAAALNLDICRSAPEAPAIEPAGGEQP